jgi:uncharacterized protein
MQVNLDNDIHSYTIRAYQPGEISLSVPFSPESAQQDDPIDQSPRPLGIETVTGSFIISPRHLLRDWAPENIDNLQTEHLSAIIELQPELVLLGTGPQLTFPAHSILAEVHQQRIGIEIMDTAAACRTYNILMAEGRFVVAGLINPAG